MSIKLTDVCMVAVDAIFQVASDWQIRCSNCKYEEKCSRKLRTSDFCSDFVFRDDEACAGLYDKLKDALQGAVFVGVKNDRK